MNDNVKKSNSIDNKITLDLHHLSSMLNLAWTLWDEDLHTIDCNEEAVKLFGLADKIEYFDRITKLSPLYQPDGSRSSEKGIAMMKKAFNEGECIFHWEHQSPNGEPIPSEITLLRTTQKDKMVVVAYIKDLRETIKTKEEDARIRTMLDTVPLCCNYWDENFNNIDCNQAAVELFDLSSKAEYLENFFALSPMYQPDGALSSEKALRMIKKAFESGKCVFEWTHQKLNGDPIPCEITLIRVNQENSTIVVGYTQDLTESIKGRQADARIKTMFDTVPLCCNYWDENYNNIDCNQEAVKLFNLSSKEEYLERFFELSPMYQPDGTLSSEKAFTMIKKASEEGKCVFEWMHQKLTGEPIPAEITLIKDKENGIILGYTHDLRGIREAVERLDNMEQLVNLANIDYLTNCYNRRGISKVLDKVNEDFSILMMDIDYFKNINDNFGHSAGDKVLIDFASLLKNNCRATDTVIRYGGEEFLIILLNTPIDVAKMVGEKIREKTESDLLLPDGSTTTVSIGIAVRENSESIEDCINRADQALYISKSNGRNMVSICNEK